MRNLNPLRQLSLESFRRPPPYVLKYERDLTRLNLQIIRPEGQSVQPPMEHLSSAVASDVVFTVSEKTEYVRKFRDSSSPEGTRWFVNLDDP